MLNIKGKNVGIVSINGKEVDTMMVNGNIVYEAGNLRTADNKILKTVDNKVLNVNK